jgi:hypothetical protein
MEFEGAESVKPNEEIKGGAMPIITIVMNLLKSLAKIPGLLSFVFQIIKWGLNIITQIFKWAMEHFGEGFKSIVEVIKKWFGQKTAELMMATLAEDIKK